MEPLAYIPDHEPVIDEDGAVIDTEPVERILCVCHDEITGVHLERGYHTCMRPVHLVIGAPVFGIGHERPQPEAAAAEATETLPGIDDAR